MSGRVFQIVEEDPYLKPYEKDFEYRVGVVDSMIKKIDDHECGLDVFSRGYERFGFNRCDTGIRYSEWAPGAKALSLVGDFNGWDGSKNPCTRDNFGVWSCIVPDKADGSEGILHGSHVKARLVTEKGETVDRIPAWIKRVIQRDNNVHYDAQYWNPPKKYMFVNPRPRVPSNLKVYECHVGMGGIEPKVGTYKEFTAKVLPRAKRLGYNCVQLMAIMEHAYYASFGYHITNFFAASSRCGTPEDLKELVDTAHGLGLTIIMDVIHSHASKNVLDGLNEFDGTDHQYFHSGPRGNHDLWDSRLFNYGHWEVLRFLLSNLRWWVEEYGFDGFRFDGVTSMTYRHHGLSVGFTGNYDEYFGFEQTDDEAVTYMMLANKMLHDSYGDHIITIAEDVSGRPGMCRRVDEGGIGFDYRLGMAIPDKWIKLLKEVPDEEWKMGDIVHTLCNRRHKERTIGYAESHDQALVGDKTIAFRLMDKEMYDHMSVLGPLHPVIDRGMALHKLIRLITCTLGGEGWLTFFGNEFGHPEWIDFPREGNGNSFHHARRRWDLAEDPLLRYQQLENFEKSMLDMEEKYKWLGTGHEYVSLKHEGDKVIVFERGDLVFVFNFHATQSFPDYKIGVKDLTKYAVVLSSDIGKFGGHDRVKLGGEYFAQPEPWNERPHSMFVYTPSRTCVVYAPSK